MLPLNLKRDNIINLLQTHFFPKPHILAHWLGGSDANNETDEYSDIDCFFSVQDGAEEQVLQEAHELLANLGSLDYIENIEYRSEKISQTFHIAGTSENLLIEIILVPQSRGMTFIEGHPAFKPKIIFDKANIIHFEPLDEAELKRKILSQLTEQKNLMAESGRAEKYIQRGEYIEATNYYIKYVYLPLVSVLRIKHTPLLHDWLRIHISRHFPRDIVLRLEDLMKFQSGDDIMRNIAVARGWFEEVVKELEEA